MKTKSNMIGLIAKKCFQLKEDKNIDAFFEYSPHVDEIRIDVFLNWDKSKDPVYSKRKYLDGVMCSRSNHIEILEDLIKDLDSIYYGLGVE